MTGHFEQYVLNDVVAFVDANHRTIPYARSRGVFGFSSGGFGAWNLASRNPEDFGAMAVLSADSFLDMTHKFRIRGGARSGAARYGAMPRTGGRRRSAR